MAVSLVNTMTNNNELPTMNYYSKQTQTKPISYVPILQRIAKWGPSDYSCLLELCLYNQRKSVLIRGLKIENGDI